MTLILKDIVDTGEEDWLLALKVNGQDLFILVPKDVHPNPATGPYSPYGLNLVCDGHYR